MTEWMTVITIRYALPGADINATISATPICVTRAEAYDATIREAIALIPGGGASKRNVSVSFWYCEPNHPVTP